MHIPRRPADESVYGPLEIFRLAASGEHCLPCDCGSAGRTWSRSSGRSRPRCVSPSSVRVPLTNTFDEMKVFCSHDSMFAGCKCPNQSRLIHFRIHAFFRFRADPRTMSRFFFPFVFDTRVQCFFLILVAAGGCPRPPMDVVSSGRLGIL